jgi:hypothetical protein
MMVPVTLESPRGRLTLAVPDDAPVEALLPELVEACGCEEEGFRWSLRARGGPVLNPSFGLEQNGVYRGAILELLPGQPWRRGEASWAEVLVDRGARALASLRPTRAGDTAAAASRRAVAEATVPTPLLLAVLATEREAGATTVAALLGIVLARLRRERVAAVDADPRHATLSQSLAEGRRPATAELVAAASPAGRASLLSQLVAGPHGLLVLPAPLPDGAEAHLEQALYAALLAQLSRAVVIAVADCGPADQGPGRAVLASADLGVLVCRPDELDGGAVEERVRRLRRSCRSVVAVANRARSKPPAVPGADATLALSDEARAAAGLRGGTFAWAAAPPSWQVEVPALAAALLTGRGARRWHFSTEAVGQLRDR